LAHHCYSLTKLFPKDCKSAVELPSFNLGKFLNLPYAEPTASPVNSINHQHASVDLIDSAYAARRLFITLLLMTLGGSSMYVVSVVLPEVQRDFGVSRADASLPYTLMMLGFGAGGLAMGKLADRWGVHVAL
jgi:hypothetical protein